MARFEKNAAGEDVDVTGPEFGCITVEAAAPEPATEPAPASKAKDKPAKGDAPAAEEGTA